MSLHPRTHESGWDERVVMSGARRRRGRAGQGGMVAAVYAEASRECLALAPLLFVYAPAFLAKFFSRT